MARIFRSRAVLWWALAALGLLSCIPYERFNWIWYTQTSAAALLAAVLLLHHAANPVRAELGPVVAIGKISFSIYLMHGLVIDTISSTHIVNPQFDAVMIFSMIVGISLLTYRWIELPFIALSKRLAPFAVSRPIEERQPLLNPMH
jgi:peptidoglycan/LPS O-acetylase OafA/YrhL